MLKTKKFRRLLAGLLAVLMLSVCLPVGAFADDGNDASAASASTTQVTFQFTDGEAFSESVLGSGIYTVGETYAADDITAAMPEGFELEDQNFTFTVKTVSPTILVPVKREALKKELAFLFTDNATFSKTVISERIYEIGGTFTADDISVPLPEGFELEDPNFTFTVTTVSYTHLTLPTKLEV